MSRTYAEAVASLNTLQSNFAIVDAIRKSGRKMNDEAIPEMIEWCKKVGYTPSDLNSLHPIHIAGTKGKGSTAAFISSILSQFRDPDAGQGQVPSSVALSKVGLYTSPHLRFVRERIQIDGKPLTEEQFARYFFQIWDRLEVAATAAGQDPRGPSAKPVYFRFLTLMAFHTYMSEEVNAAVIECGIGGAFDSTNILDRPTVTGITSLGIDHVGVLGSTLAEIAWHKSGIMRHGIKCFTPSSQKEEAKAVMDRMAAEKGAELHYVDIDPAIESGEIELGLQADFQKINASVALAIAREYLRQKGYPDNQDTEQRIRKGLETVHWPGRCETRHENNITWCIDGGHTLDSIEMAGRWFASQIVDASSSSSPADSTTNTTTATTTMPPAPPPSSLSATSHKNKPKTKPRFLIFNQQTRDASLLASALYTTLTTALKTMDPFTHVIFCTNTTFASSGFRPDLVSMNTNALDVDTLSVQNKLAETWRRLDDTAEVNVVKSIEEAVALVRDAGRRLASHKDQDSSSVDEIVVLVTGSLHLVGGFLEVLESSVAGPEQGRTLGLG